MNISDALSLLPDQKIAHSPHFMFYFGSDLEFARRMKHLAGEWFGNLVCVERPGFILLIPKRFAGYTCAADAQSVFALTGWARSLALPPVDFQSPASFEPHLFKVAREILRGWPLPDSDLTGNFSGMLYHIAPRQLSLLADPGSIYPLYYDATPTFGVAGGTHLLFLAHLLNREADWAGVVERLSPPGYINYGSRTIYQQVKRVLPGEMIQWEWDTFSAKKQYDFSFFEQSSDGGNLDALAGKVWDHYQADIRICVGNSPSVNLGLSGGWDSRLVAAALPGHSTRCFTYAVKKDEYEVRIAKQVAKCMQARFVFSDFSPTWMPTKERFLQNLLATEATLIPEWISILDQFPSQTLEPFLLGDMFEAVAGRYVYRLSSRAGRKKLYWDRELGRAQLPIRNKERVMNWEAGLLSSVLSSADLAMSCLHPDVIGSLDKKEIRKEIEQDVHDVFERIINHGMIFMDSFDELQAWYMKCSLGISKQILTLNERFFGLNPTMSFRSLRLISAIHPFYRTNGQLMHRIQQLPDLRPYSKIPNANAPFIPSSSPLWLSDLVWAARSMLDQRLIAHALKRRNMDGRMRVLKTHNIVHLYNLPGAYQKGVSWFSGQVINPERFLAEFRNRAEMKNWPVYNYDITAPASLSLMLDLHH